MCRVNWLMRFWYWLNRVMAGRHGGDQLSVALVVLYCVLMLLADLLLLPALFYLALAALFWGLFRMLSRNNERRWRENQWFLGWWLPLWGHIRGFFHRIAVRRRNAALRFRDRKVWRYYRCPKCGSTLRVPKGKGKIAITCPVCGTEFIKKT